MKEILYTTNVSEAAAVEQSLGPGVYDIRLELTEKASPEDLVSIVEHLSANGIDVVSVNQWEDSGVWVVSIKYRKAEPSEVIGFLPLAVIPLIAFGFVAVLVGVGIYKIEDISNNIGKLLLITLGGVAVIAFALRKPIETVGTAYVKGR